MPWNNQNEVTHKRVFEIVLHWARVECDCLLVPTDLLQLFSDFCILPVCVFPKEYTIEGFLEVTYSLKKPWKERYFRLNHNFLLKTATPTAGKLQTLPMEHAKVRVSEMAPLCFTVKFKKGKMYFRTKSSSDTQQWLECLTKASHLKVKDIYRFLYTLGTSVSQNTKVVAAEHRTTRKKLAVKIVDKRLCDQRMLRKDVAILRTLESQYLVQMYDLFETRKFLYFVMEKCEGGEVLNAIAAMDGDLYSEALCCGIMHQVASGVAHFHDNGILLRDLRPANVLCVKPNCFDQIKLAGFGVSKFVADFVDTAPNFAVRYLAPEALVWVRYAHEVDFWSVGVMMYFLFCGCHAISDDALRSPLFVRGDIEFLDEDWAHVSQRIVEIVKGLLQKDTSKRTTVEELAKATWNVSAEGGQSYKDAHCKLKKHFFQREYALSERRTAEC